MQISTIEEIKLKANFAESGKSGTCFPIQIKGIAKLQANAN